MEFDKQNLLELIESLSSIPGSAEVIQEVKRLL